MPRTELQKRILNEQQRVNTVTWEQPDTFEIVAALQLVAAAVAQLEATIREGKGKP